MKIKNKDFSPRVIRLARGKSLTLPARGSAEISDEDFKSAECQRLFAARTIIVLPERRKKASGTTEQASDNDQNTTDTTSGTSGRSQDAPRRGSRTS